MDYLLETAAELLPRVRAALRQPGAPQASAGRQPETPASAGADQKPSDLRTIAAAWQKTQLEVLKRRTAAAAQAHDAPGVATDVDEEEALRAAPDVLAVEVLADVLARRPDLIGPALREAGKPEFSPTFLKYVVGAAIDIALGFRPLLPSGQEYSNLRDERRERMCKLLLDTDTARRLESERGPAAPPAGPRMAPASILGTGEAWARTLALKDQCVRVTRRVVDEAKRGPAERRVAALRSDPRRADRFERGLRHELLGKPALVRDFAELAAVAVPFETAFGAEVDEIRASRPRRGVMAAPPAADRHPLRAAADMDLLGLAFSGGGVRSATFNLGVLQALAKIGLLHRVDYLSTVSGGGYIGAWLASWCKRVKEESTGGSTGEGVKAVQDLLQTEPLSDPDAPSVRAVRFLREYSNYLTPRAGVFTADTWTMIAIWLRNTLLNQAVLVLTLCGVLAVPWMVWALQAVMTPRMSFMDPDAYLTSPQLPACSPNVFVSAPLVATAAAVLLLFASGVTGQQLRRFGALHHSGQSDEGEMLPQAGVLVQIVAPAIVAAWLLAVALYDTLPCTRAAGITRAGIWPLGALFAGCIVIVAARGRYWRCFEADRVAKEPTPWTRLKARGWAALIIGGATAVASAGAAVALGWAAAEIASRTTSPARLSVAFLALGVPAVVAALSLLIVLKIGILGRNLLDQHREWWSRLGAWLNIVSLAWLILAGISLYSPVVIEAVWEMRDGLAAAAAGSGWAAWTIAGVILGKRERPEGSGAAARLREGIVAAAPYVFILGLLMLMSSATYEALLGRAPEDLAAAILWEPHYWTRPRWLWMAGLGPVLLLASLLLSWRVDVNEFSMHHFYKNRLVRCYLGASRDHPPSRMARDPDPFTGFDAADDLKLARLRVDPGDPDGDDPATPTPEPPYVGPVPIINAALNLVKGDDLAWQERKAQSFVFTPFYSGYEYRGTPEPPHHRHAPYGFRPTPLLGYPPSGVGLGTAVAISGAAASPNMGYHSSPPAAFLMTMFNARLGWWMGNPRDKHDWLRSGPRRGLLYLLNELFGLTNDRTHYVNLSDGGHFDNLGIYELVRRRCRYIVACDAEQDTSMAFNGLGNAVRKCRTDLGAEITISATRIRPAEEGTLSPLHCVVGDITYADGEKGTLLYLKASVTGDEPADVLEYATRERSFPHHPTLSDQFFDESQFESYRKLGFHIGYVAFAVPRRAAGNDLDLSALFSHMRDYWHPGDPRLDERRGTHTAQYDRLLEQLMRNPALSFADAAFFDPAAEALEDRPRLFIGAQLLDLMQRVYIDLDLDNDTGHPHNAGWIAIFKRWKGHPAVQAAWQASSRAYGRRFRSFYKAL